MLSETKKDKLGREAQVVREESAEQRAAGVTSVKRHRRKPIVLHFAKVDLPVCWRSFDRLVGEFVWRVWGVPLTVAVGNASKEFNRSEFDHKRRLQMKKSTFGPGWVRNEMDPVVWGERRHKVGAESEATRFCQWLPT